MKKWLAIIGSVILVVTLLWSVAGIKVYAKDRANNDTTQYQLEEKTFLGKVRNALEEQGYFNSGITLTKVMDGDGTREYTVLVHNSHIDSNSQKENVYSILNSIRMEKEKAQVVYEIF